MRSAATRIGRTAAVSGFDGRAALQACVGRRYHAERDFNVIDGAVEMSQDEWRENGRAMLELVNNLKNEVASVKAGTVLPSNAF
jgi:hypothetical protein